MLVLLYNVMPHHAQKVPCLISHRELDGKTSGRCTHWMCSFPANSVIVRKNKLFLLTTEGTAKDYRMKSRLNLYLGYGQDLSRCWADQD